MAEISQSGDYPKQEIKVVAFPEDLSQLYPAPRGSLSWPPVQLTYLSAYLSALGCRTVVMESHYVDRDYIDDMSLLYSRSLRAYQNYCGRLHFFTETFDQDRWRKLVIEVGRGAN